MNPAGLEEVKRVFNRQISEGLHPGAGLAVYRYGSLVLDIHGGVADSGTGSRVDDKTMFVLFSSTKPLAGACIYMLKERGRLEWDDPVAKFWPEFGQNGKETVTIRHLLSHQGGVPPRRLPICPGPTGMTGASSAPLWSGRRPSSRRVRHCPITPSTMDG